MTDIIAYEFINDIRQYAVGDLVTDEPESPPFVKRPMLFAYEIKRAIDQFNVIVRPWAPEWVVPKPHWPGDRTEFRLSTRKITLAAIADFAREVRRGREVRGR